MKQQISKELHLTKSMHVLHSQQNVHASVWILILLFLESAQVPDVSVTDGFNVPCSVQFFFKTCIFYLASCIHYFRIYHRFHIIQRCCFLIFTQLLSLQLAWLLLPVFLSLSGEPVCSCLCFPQLSAISLLLQLRGSKESSDIMERG